MTSSWDVIIVGAGFAGLTAGSVLASRGARVLVLDARPQLGGRATAFRDRHTGELVDNGQHVLFGCYRETLEFLRLVGASDHVRAQTSLELVCFDRARRRSVLRCPAVPAPLHLLAGVMRWSAIPLADRLSALRLAMPLLSARRQLTGARTVSVSPADATVQQWLDQHRQGPVLQEWLWHPLAVAALNQLPEDAAADAFVRVLAEMFAPDPAAAGVVLPVRPLHEMYAEPAREFIRRHGGEVRTSSLARISVERERVAGVQVRDESFTAPAIVAAVPWFAIRALFGPSSPAALAALFATSAAMVSMPIVTVNLWYDRPVMGDAFAGLPGRAMQWVFDKRAAFGGSASHLSLVSSGANAIVGRSNQELTDLAAREIEASLPDARGVWPIRGTVVREKQATFSLAPGQPRRPGVRTGIGGLLLAGDWTDTGLPATIEGAVVSGNRAAAAVLAGTDKQ